MSRLRAFLIEVALGTTVAALLGAFILVGFNILGG